jgi:hypothetical protein
LHQTVEEDDSVMEMANRIAETGVDRMLLIVTEEPDKHSLSRVGDAAHALGAELFVFCPALLPDAPSSGSVAAAPALVEHDRSARRVEAKRVAFAAAAELEQHSVGTHVESSEFPSITHGILDAARRVDPDILVLPKVSASETVDASTAVSYEQLWTKLGITTWIMQRGSVANDSIVGLIELDSEINAGKAENANVASATTELAKALNVQAHLLCCDGKSGVLEMAEAAMALQITRVTEGEDRDVVRELFDLASHFEVPNTRIHLDRGSEDEIIERIVDPLGVGMVVAHARPRNTFGGLITRHNVPDITNSQCDLLVLGERDARVTGLFQTIGEMK